MPDDNYVSVPGEQANLILIATMRRLGADQSTVYRELAVAMPPARTSRVNRREQMQVYVANLS